MFSLEDIIFFPGHGVAVVEEFDDKKILDSTVRVVKLSFMYKDQTIWVPLGTIMRSGVRYLSTEKMIDDAFDELLLNPERAFESTDFTPSGWNRRFKRCQALMQTGILRDLMKVYRDFMHISKQKELSFGEKTLMTLVEDLIVQEILTVKKTEKELIVQQLKTPFLQQKDPTTLSMHA